MSNFRIEIGAGTSAGDGDPRPIAISANGTVFTRLLRPGQKEPDDYLNAPADRLAFWLIDNWWRLRWECIPPEGLNVPWRLAHEIASIGSGYAWPLLSFWGEGERVGILARADPPGVMGPVRFLTNSLSFVPSRDFEREVERFLLIAGDESNGYGSQRSVLRALLESLNREREDPEVAAWRRMEAALGFDQDEAPESLMSGMAGLITRYEQEGLEEAALAAPGLDALKVLRSEAEAAETCGLACDLEGATRAAQPFQYSADQAPWLAAEVAARNVRHCIGVSGVLGNKRLGELLGLPTKAFSDPSQQSLRYGLRLKNGSYDRVLLKSRRQEGRRFQAARALGDSIWSNQSAIGPLADSKTSRQKFQRAFAQSLLCPFEDLKAYLKSANPSDYEDQADAARYFHVSVLTVQSVLKNKGVISDDFFSRLEVA